MSNTDKFQKMAESMNQQYSISREFLKVIEAAMRKVDRESRSQALKVAANLCSDYIEPSKTKRRILALRRQIAQERGR